MQGYAMPDHVHMCVSIPPQNSKANADRSVEGEVGDSYSPVAF